VKAKLPPRSKGGVARGLQRSSRSDIDRLLPPDLESRPPVADWLAFLAQLLAAEAIREFADRGGAE
jgi:hypothetical protein